MIVKSVENEISMVLCYSGSSWMEFMTWVQRIISIKSSTYSCLFSQVGFMPIGK